MYQMIKPHALQEFQRQRTQGLEPRNLPEGAFDVLHSRIRKRLAQDGRSVSTDPIRVEDHLSGSMRKALDQMSPETQAAIVKHLGRDQLPLLGAAARGLGALGAGAEAAGAAGGAGEAGEALGAGLAGLQAGAQAARKEDDDDEASDQAPDQIEQICAMLEEAGVPEEVIEQVRERLGATESDGNLAILHKGDRRLLTTKKAFDSPAYGTGPVTPRSGAVPGGPAQQYGADMPPPFSGRPTPGGQMLPITSTASQAADRRLARDAARHTKIADAAGGLHYAKDAPRAGRGTRMAFDSNSLRNFHRRFPDAARIRVLG
jgi:hypothetical protein